MSTEFLPEQLEDRCVKNAPACSFTTYRAGGNIDLLLKPKDLSEIQLIFDYSNKNSLPVNILGRGSNILIGDKGLHGLTIYTGLLDDIEVKENIVKAYCGALWDTFVLKCIKNGLSGYEKTSGIPGSLGGAVRMNAGAYGCETFDMLKNVFVVFPDGKTQNISKEELSYSYRYVSLPPKCFILSAVFELKKGNSGELMKVREEVLSSRTKKQPLEFPSAGSVFKRPPNDYASRLIDFCGLKGLSVGGAEVSVKHAGFIINKGNATATDIFRLIKKVREEVKKKTGVELQLEQILLGEFSESDFPGRV